MIHKDPVLYVDGGRNHELALYQVPYLGSEIVNPVIKFDRFWDKLMPGRFGFLARLSTLRPYTPEKMEKYLSRKDHGLRVWDVTVIDRKIGEAYLDTVEIAGHLLDLPLFFLQQDTFSHWSKEDVSNYFFTICGDHNPICIRLDFVVIQVEKDIWEAV